MGGRRGKGIGGERDDPGADEGEASRPGSWRSTSPPLRALNRDMLSRLRSWGEELGVSVAVRHGDTTQAERQAQSLRPPDLLITTPETLQVMLTGKRLRSEPPGRQDRSHRRGPRAGGTEQLQLAVVLERMTEVAGEFQRVGLRPSRSPENIAEFLVGLRVPDRPGRRAEGEVPGDIPSQRAATTPSRELECDPSLASQIRSIREAVWAEKSRLRQHPPGRRGPGVELQDPRRRSRGPPREPIQRGEDRGGGGLPRREGSGG